MNHNYIKLDGQEFHTSIASEQSRADFIANSTPDLYASKGVDRETYLGEAWDMAKAKLDEQAAKQTTDNPAKPTGNTTETKAEKGDSKKGDKETK